MSTESQQQQFDIGVENERRTAQYRLNEIEALYGPVGRTCYILGRADRAIETANNEAKHLEQRTAEAGQTVSSNGDNPVRTVRRNIRPRVRSQAKAALHND